jgi:hypothetical protein
VRNVELLPTIALALALALAYLRWIVLSQWTCRHCGAAHIRCECKPAWVRLLL